jgi:hypothetical protein
MTAPVQRHSRVESEKNPQGHPRQLGGGKKES